MGRPIVNLLLNGLLGAVVLVQAGVVDKRQSPPSTLPDNWSYKGCYTDSVAARTLKSSGTAGNDMSAAECIAYCGVRGYALAGTEYSTECYCGNTIANGGTVATDGCNMACGGAPGEACGGSNRISVYEKATTAGGPSASDGPGNWGSLGCYEDSVGARILASVGNVNGGPANMSAESCTDACGAANYKYAGTEYSGECYCGNTLDNGHTKQDDGCDMLCNGNQLEICGGSNRINIYEFGAKDTTPKTGWISQGCYTDSVAGRTLSVGMGVDGGAAAMTNEKCQTACMAAGFIWAGTEYSGECYCDSQLRNGGGPADDGTDGCNMLCNGDNTEICGGSNRLTMFKYISASDSTSSSSASSAPSSTPAPSSTVASSSTATRTNTASATATGLPDGFAYKGCYVDGPGFRIMNFQQNDDSQMTIASCSQKCASLGYSIAGMEYSTQCFCDNVIRMSGSLASDDSQCGMACGGDATEKCGGPNRLSIWSSQGNLTVVRKPTPKQKVDGWGYQGCITDPQDHRVFPWQLINATSMTPELCLGQCKKFGYMAAGIEYGQECYCGDLENIEAAGSTVAPESDCNMACPGDAESICGAGLRLTWYKWVDDPLYVWEYPKGNLAGRYEFLVGGPVIPLISQPAINGKVMLLEKKGTGPPNSTGAYEFDPSIGGDIYHAFRQMEGIKTDIFCSAGLTMPDKAGRQINIGGWSLDSTFGVRIHTPDGTLGVNGTSAWKENVQVLKLQKGRWYPTAMVMANGSMLVVGGEDGSNGNPVPSMEILPRAGGVYEADYLRETDPFNLYPFLVVLPSGGIFIGYYNQARVINEVTLDTVKVLPQIPAAISDPAGGRTYPLEGTQVLLPQYAPYTDPLEILICGGATQNPAWGIDNCVSIAPDAENPEWTIERMPSPRVISCMATLPDGTYLILNGAKTGVAGFGLAKDPNQNALLYDSRKPVNRRISVMANTTIPRLYHSEAVLLDDGRVLVTGSDPEDPDFDQEYRVEQFLPPYLLDNRTQPSFTMNNTDWSWDGNYSFTVNRPNGDGDLKVSLLGSESSTHGNSMGARILFPSFSCSGASAAASTWNSTVAAAPANQTTTCTVTAPPGPYVAPVGWYRMYVLEGPTPSHAKWVRIGGDPAELGNWPNYPDFMPLPGV